MHHLTEQHWEDLKVKGFPIPKDKSRLEATLAVMEAPEDVVHEQFLRDVDQLLHLTTTDFGVISGEERRNREAVLAAEHEKKPICQRTRHVQCVSRKRELE